MNFYFITFRTITAAQRGERVLQKKGIRCQLSRTPRWMEEQGCGYCLRLRTDDVMPAVRLLQSAQVPFRRVYVQRQKRFTPVGNWRENCLIAKQIAWHLRPIVPMD